MLSNDHRDSYLLNFIIHSSSDYEDLITQIVLIFFFFLQKKSIIIMFSIDYNRRHLKKLFAEKS